MDKLEGSLLVVDDSEMNRDMLTRRWCAGDTRWWRPKTVVVRWT